MKPRSKDPVSEAPQVSCVVTLVSPDMAMSWLDNQHHNRPVREHVVEMYRRDMQLGNWELTGQGISLDRDGLLVDGQHRLAALVRFNRPVWMLVTRGVSHDVAIRACDSGPPRTGGQRMGMQGEKNGALKAAISRGLFVLTNPEVPHSGMVAHSNLNTALNRYRQSIEAVVGGSSLVRVPSLPRAIAAAMIDVVPEYGIPFIEGVMTGANLASGDSRLALRNWMSARVGKSSYEEMWARSIAAADAFMNDESVHKLMSSSRTRYIRWASNLNLPVNRSLLTAISR